MENNIKDFFKSYNIKVYGFACLDKETKKEIFLSEHILEKLNSAVVFALPLSKGVLNNITDGPDLLYLSNYRQINYILDRTALLLSGLFEENNFFAVPIPVSQIVDWEKQRAHLSHKKIARIAGLGWIGRNNLLVNPEYGSRLRFVTVLTSAKLQPCEKILPFGCADCFVCMKICPAGAIKEKSEEFRHLICYEKIKEMTNKRKISQNVCGLCIKACKL